MTDGTITLSQLESHLWEAANILRGPVDAADFKTYVFPLLFFKRISDVYDEEYAAALAGVRRRRRIRVVVKVVLLACRSLQLSCEVNDIAGAEKRARADRGSLWNRGLCAGSADNQRSQ